MKKAIKDYIRRNGKAEVPFRLDAAHESTIEEVKESNVTKEVKPFFSEKQVKPRSSAESNGEGNSANIPIVKE